MSVLYGTEVAWPYGGQDVFVVGSWSGWRERVRLGADGRALLQLPRGFHTYKFVVDGRWCYDVLKPQATDSAGNINNVLCVPRGEHTVQTLPLLALRPCTASSPDDRNNGNDGSRSDKEEEEEEETWNAQREACARALARRRPAVVCTQRGQRDQLAYLCQRAGPYRRTGLAERGEYCAVLWDAEQLHHVASGDFWLSERPHVPGSRFAGAPAARMATWALLQPYASTEPAILVCSTALEGRAGAEGAALRARQAEVLAEQLDKLVAAVCAGTIRDEAAQAPVALAAVVLAGQFGEQAAGSHVHELLERRGFCDCTHEAKTVDPQLTALKGAAEEWMLVKKRPRASAAAAKETVSWCPSARTDVVGLALAADPSAPGCQHGHLPLQTTLVVTELPYLYPATTATAT